MKRTDLIAFAKFYSARLRAEAVSRRKKYPEAADQLERWADTADRQAEAMRSGPLFGTGSEA